MKTPPGRRRMCMHSLSWGDVLLEQSGVEADLVYGSGGGTTRVTSFSLTWLFCCPFIESASTRNGTMKQGGIMGVLITLRV